jgi:hypothetical protein
MATPSWIKSIGDALRPIAQTAAKVVLGPVSSLLGGNSASPAAVTATKQVQAQAVTGSPDAGRANTASAASIFGLKKETAMILGVAAVATVIVVMARK